MLHDFQPGDFLIFQLESGYALLRVLNVDKDERDGVWHLMAYNDLFLDTEIADAALEDPTALGVDRSHVALTNRAFESTPVAKLRNIPLTAADLSGYEGWRSSDERPVSDRSIRLLLGLR